MQTEPPDDLKRDDELPVDIEGALDALQFQLDRIQETLTRLRAAVEEQ